jgi:hypothetical protein
LRPSESRYAVLAYTSKAPYLLNNEGFDAIAKSGATWLPKGRYGVQSEREAIEHEIAAVRATKQWRNKWLRGWTTGLRGMLLSGLLSGIIGIALGHYLLPLLGWDCSSSSKTT